MELPVKSIIDIHSHMLPAVDDGCGSREEALAMLRIYEAQNVEAVICTPHYGQFSGANVEKAYQWLKSASAGTNLRVYLGNEILYTGSVLRDIRSGKARRLAGTDWILVEFEEWDRFSTPAEEILEGMRKLSESEFRPILAHPERYASLQNHPEYCRPITELGVKLQINAYDIRKNVNTNTRNLTRKLLEDQLVSFVGSDAHGAVRRAPDLLDGVQWIYDHCPEDYADAIVHDNAEEIIKRGSA